MTLLARNEADIVGHQIRYHLSRGVDFVIATDHRSVDATTDILRAFDREGRLHLIEEPSEMYTQAEWVTRMARLAATDFGADWVINTDADEFWWPRHGTIKETLAAVPRRFGAVRGLVRHFVPRPERGGESFHERMIVRCAPVPVLSSPYHEQVKVAHRADPQVVVPRGNHDAFGDRLTLIRSSYPFEVLHFPIRDRAQLERKYRTKFDSYSKEQKVAEHVLAMVAALDDAEAQDVYDRLLVDDEELEQGLVSGRCFVDTRLRDTIATGVSTTRSSTEGDAGIAVEIDAHQARDNGTLLSGRVDAFEQRLTAVEHAVQVSPRQALVSLTRTLRRGRRT